MENLPRRLSGRTEDSNSSYQGSIPCGATNCITTVQQTVLIKLHPLLGQGSTPSYFRFGEPKACRVYNSPSSSGSRQQSLKLPFHWFESSRRNHYERGVCPLKYLIIICVTLLLWKLIDVIPDLIAATHNRKPRKSYKWTDSYFKDDNN